MNTPKRKIHARPLAPKRPRKLGVYIQSVEYYSPEDLAAIDNGIEQIKRGEYVTHDELKRRNEL